MSSVFFFLLSHSITCVCIAQDVIMECSLLLPDSLVLEIFLRLPHDAVLRAGLTCRQWLAVSRDEFLWRDLFYHYYRIPRSVPRHPGKRSRTLMTYEQKKHTWVKFKLTLYLPFMQRPCHGTGSSSVCLTVSPVWRSRRWRSTATRSSTWLFLTRVTGSLPAPKTALLR